MAINAICAIRTIAAVGLLIRHQLACEILVTRNINAGVGIEEVGRAKADGVDLYRHHRPVCTESSLVSEIILEETQYDNVPSTRGL